jgi:hypothetical protein
MAFSGFLMPTPFSYRWDHNALIPSLLYFDRVTFLMDDIQSCELGKLRSPQELEGMGDDVNVDGLFPKQHRYFWPMRDLMREGVIAISSQDLGPFVNVSEVDEALDNPIHGDHKLARRFMTAAAEYHRYLKGDTDLTDRDKAEEVYSWIRNTIDWINRRKGYNPVFVHPAGFAAFKWALELFPDQLDQLWIKAKLSPDAPDPVDEGASTLAIAFMRDMLKKGLPTLSWMMILRRCLRY